MKDPNIVEVKFDVSQLKKLTPFQHLEIFKELQTKTTTQISLEYGFNNRYKDMNQSRAAVYSVYRKVLTNPEVYGATPQLVEAVKHAVENRKAGKNIKTELIDQREKVNFIRSELDGIRDKAAKIISMKLDRALISKKERNQLGLKELSQVLATVVDKGRLLGGQSTENVLHYAKVAKDISPEEALKLVLKAREAIIESNQ